MRTRLILLIGSALAIGAAVIAGAPAAWAIPGASLEDGSGSSAPQAAVDPQSEARYEAALALMKKGDALSAQAAGAGESATHPGASGAGAGATVTARRRARSAAREAYASARAKLQALTARSPSLAAAWNALGYTQRQLGSYDDALASYARALELRPGYPEALEYRGEAYLRLDRIADAKQAYLDLFSTNRTLSRQLLVSMKSWIEARRKSPGADLEEVSELEQWVQERSRIAAQTAALTRAGAAASWR